MPKAASKRTPLTRSEVMSRVRSRDTSPELAVRSALHRAGVRFRLHRKDLPGKPDIVLSSRRAVIFVHGCFWHQHPGCRRARRPASRTDYWDKKLTRNIERDAKDQAALRAAGWSVIVLWECEIRNAQFLTNAVSEIVAIPRTLKSDTAERGGRLP